jgi:uncharacterized protein involved in oxidation of intracellular sulfur
VIIGRGKPVSSVLITLQEGPYGSEMPFSALKLAGTILEEHPGTAVRLFLVSDAVGCAIEQQTPPEGWPNIGEMLRDVIGRGAEVKLCVTCIKARGLAYVPLIAGAEVGNMSDFARWTVESGKVISL